MGRIEKKLGKIEKKIGFIPPKKKKKEKLLNIDKEIREVAQEFNDFLDGDPDDKEEQE